MSKQREAGDERPRNKFRYMTLDEIERHLKRQREAGTPNEIAEALYERAWLAATGLEVGEWS